MQSRKPLIVPVSKIIRLMKRTLPMLLKNPNPPYTTSLTTTSQHDQPEKTKNERRNRQRQTLGMLRISKGRYHLVSIQSRKPLILTVSNMILLMERALPMPPKSPILQPSPSLTTMSQHHQPRKIKKNKEINLQRQPLGMPGIPKGRYHSGFIQSRKLLILLASKMIRLVK